jgi:hypothetical protein
MNVQTWEGTIHLRFKSRKFLPAWLAVKNQTNLQRADLFRAQFVLGATLACISPPDSKY